FMQRRADAPDHAADILAVRGARVHDVTAGKGADNARHPDFAGSRVNSDLDEFGAERVGDIVLALCADHSDVAVLHGLGAVIWRTGGYPFDIFLDHAGTQPIEHRCELLAP